MTDTIIRMTAWSNLIKEVFQRGKLKVASIFPLAKSAERVFLHEKIEEALETLEPDTVRNCYSILGLFKEIHTPLEVKYAYRRLIREYHPDKVERCTEERKKIAAVRARKINLAYDYLKKRGLAGA